MQATQITADELRTAGHVLIGFAGILVTAIGLLLRTAYKLGRDAQKFGEGLEAITVIKAEVAKIPLIELHIGNVEAFTRKNTSDISHLMRGSRPDTLMYPNGGGHNDRNDD